MMSYVNLYEQNWQRFFKLFPLLSVPVIAQLRKSAQRLVGEPNNALSSTVTCKVSTQHLRWMNDRISCPMYCNYLNDQPLTFFSVAN